MLIVSSPFLSQEKRCVLSLGSSILSTSLSIILSVFRLRFAADATSECRDVTFDGSVVSVQEHSPSVTMLDVFVRDRIHEQLE